VNPATVRAAWWALRALRSAREQLSAGHLHDVVLPAPPRVPDGALRGVEAVLRRRRNSCLERAMLLQHWHAGHGRPLDVLVGVTGSDGFGAHAWLEDEPAPARFAELFRVRP
jgi:hypothetical protein